MNPKTVGSDCVSKSHADGTSFLVMVISIFDKTGKGTGKREGGLGTHSDVEKSTVYRITCSTGSCLLLGRHDQGCGDTAMYIAPVQIAS